MAFRQLDRLEIEAGLKPANDNRRPDADDDGWTGRRTRPPRGRPIRLWDGDGPEPHRIKYIVEQRLLAASRAEEPRTADNDDWPLAKLLRTENLDHCMRLATRYRSVFDRAMAPVSLNGIDPEPDMFTAHRMALDESTGTLRDKGVRRLRSARHPSLEIAPARALRTDPDQPKARAKAIAKRWEGDWPLLDHLDCKAELAALRMALKRLVAPFEAAVCGGDTLDAIGRRLGFKSESARRARAAVMDGFAAVDAYWSRRMAA